MYFISDVKIRIIHIRKNGLNYVKICLTQFSELVNFIVSCYMAKHAVDSRNMVRVKVWHTHTTVCLLKNYSQRILTYYMCILLLVVKYV